MKPRACLHSAGPHPHWGESVGEASVGEGSPFPVVVTEAKWLAQGLVGIEEVVLVVVVNIESRALCMLGYLRQSGNQTQSR